jgi:hypothetical protein
LAAARATEALYRFYHPITGGPDGDGWPFGRPVTVWETYSVLQRITGIDRVDDVRLFAVNPVLGDDREQVQQLDIRPDGLVFSYQHQVQVVEG